MGTARMAAGDFVVAESLLGKAIEASVDPIYTLNARFFLSYAYFSQGKVEIAARTLETVIAATEQFGYEYVGTSANAFYGIVSAAMGNLRKGVALIHEQIQCHRQKGQTQPRSDFYAHVGPILSFPGPAEADIGIQGLYQKCRVSDTHTADRLPPR
jgi:tetratricopeptide (TPR) repeat protein